MSDSVNVLLRALIVLCEPVIAQSCSCQNMILASRMRICTGLSLLPVLQGTSCTYYTVLKVCAFPVLDELSIDR